MGREGADGHLAVSVWVRLLKAHGLMLREVRRRVSEGLTLPQFDVLVQLCRSGGGMTPGELTRALLVTAGNVTGIVDRLVRLGLVERRPVPEDRRAVRVRLTARGRRVVQRAIPRHRRDVAALLTAVAPEDLARLRDLLGRVSRALEGPGAPAGKASGRSSGRALENPTTAPWLRQPFSATLGTRSREGAAR